MARRKDPRPVPRFALTRQEAADSLGMSVDTFDRYVRDQLRVVRTASLRLYPTTELADWVERNAEMAIGEPHLEPRTGRVR